MASINALKEHSDIIGALMLREIITRYGRRGLGFFWLIGEPLLFTFGVMLIWSTIKAPYQHGLGVAPFVMTGYMSLIMFRHLVSYSMGAVSANVGVLYHQKVKILHLYIARYVLEFAGATLALAVAYTVLYLSGLVDLPHDLGLIYWGWFSLFLFGCGVAMVLSAMAMEFDVIERLVPVMMYGMLPFSGVFIMAAWVPEKYRDVYMAFPMPHTIEMVRAGVFGEFIETHYDPFYPLFWGGVLIAFGLLLIARAKEHIDAE
ncbi:ABC transporter permease [Brevundimonas pondensis]|uniref:ABC transporter permease n=2 Tax=Brevundimonas pondensis TaxID=2774189 RepID=A0ABX7SI33_9CAUL|nr:ABC transporter permease [Brevundimonas pondensis]